LARAISRNIQPIGLIWLEMDSGNAMAGGLDFLHLAGIGGMPDLDT